MKTALSLHLALAASAATGAPAFGNGQPPSDPFSVYGLRHDASSPAPQAFRRVTGARLSSGFDGDMVTLSDTDLTFYFQPARFSWTTSPVEANERDLAVVQGTELDFVFTAGPAGLRQWTFDEPLAAYGANVIDASWSSVTRLQASPSGILAGLDPVAGVIRRYNPGGPVALTDDGDELPPLPALRGALDFALLDWNHDDVEDRAILTESRLVVLDGNEDGEPLWSMELPGVENRIAAVLGSKEDRDILVWAGRVGESWFLRSQHSADLEGDFVILGAAPDVNLHAADLAGGLGSYKDSCQELLLTVDSLRTWVFTRALPMGPGEPLPFLLAPDFSQFNRAYYNHSNPILAAFAEGGGGAGSNGFVAGTGDLDRDGDLEPMFARDVDGRVAFQHDDYNPLGHVISDFAAELLPVVGETPPPPGTLRVAVIGDGNAPASATHLMAEVWRHEGTPTFLDVDLQPGLVARAYVQLEPTGGTPTDPTFDQTTVLAAGHAPDDAYHVDLRLVRFTDAGGAPVTVGQPSATDSLDAAWPTYTYYVSEWDATATQAAYQSWPGPMALADQPPSPTPITDPVKTGGGTDAGKGRGTGNGPPPIGGKSHSGETGSSLAN